MQAEVGAVVPAAADTTSSSGKSSSPTPYAPDTTPLIFAPCT